MKFQVVSDYKLTGDQPQAIDKLQKAFLMVKNTKRC